MTVRRTFDMFLARTLGGLKHRTAARFFQSTEESFTNVTKVRRGVSKTLSLQVFLEKTSTLLFVERMH